MATTGGGAGSDLSGSLSWSLLRTSAPPKNSFCSNQNIFEKTPKITELKKKTQKVNSTDRENLEYYLGKLENSNFGLVLGDLEQ